MKKEASETGGQLDETIENAILGVEPRTLPFFGLPNEIEANIRNDLGGMFDEEEQSPLRHNQEDSEDESSHELQGPLFNQVAVQAPNSSKITLKEQAQIILELSQEVGKRTLRRLKKLYLSKIETERGVDPKNPNRRFYDVVNVLVESLVLKKVGGEIEFISDEQRIEEYREEEEERRKSIQYKRRKLAHLQETQRMMSKLVRRNLKDNGDLGERVEMPVAVLTSGDEIVLQEQKKKGYYLEFRGDFKMHGDYQIVQLLALGKVK